MKTLKPPSTIQFTILIGLAGLILLTCAQFGDYAAATGATTVSSRNPLSRPAPAAKPTPPAPRPAPKTAIKQAPADILPATSVQPLGSCPQGIVEVIVAHQDDDILFMNPRLSDDIAAGICVRAIYLTAGDDGRSSTYYENRELGNQAAYSAMAGGASDWHDAYAKIGNETIFSRELTTSATYSMIYFRFPDGNTNGSGFRQTQHESLERLESGDIDTIHTIDAHISYNYQQILYAVAAVIRVDKPRSVYTQLSETEATIGDHSDHTATGRLAVQAWQLAAKPGVVTQFIGYPMGRRPVNLTDGQAIDKTRYFAAYAAFDDSICPHQNLCGLDPTYANYLQRIYSLDQ